MDLSNHDRPGTRARSSATAAGAGPADEPAAERSIEGRLAAGDEQALEDCYLALGPSVLAYLRRYVGMDDAEDVLQRTFLDVWRGAARYDPAQNLAGWVFTIARRRAIDTIRSRRPAVVSVDAVRDLVGEDGRITAERFAWAAEVRWSLTLLPPAQRQVLELAYFEDRTQQDISRMLGVPIGTVKSRMARGTTALARLLGPDHDNYPSRESGEIE